MVKSPGCSSALQNDTVGHYRWTRVGGVVLHFKALNADPCERKDIFDDVSFKLVDHLP